MKVLIFKNHKKKDYSPCCYSQNGYYCFIKNSDEQLIYSIEDELICMGHSLTDEQLGSIDESVFAFLEITKDQLCFRGCFCELMYSKFGFDDDVYEMVSREIKSHRLNEKYKNYIMSNK